MAKRGPITLALLAALRAKRAEKMDQGSVALAKMYAAELDAAGLLHAAALACLEEINADDVPTHRHVERLSDALSARQCVIDVGPKFLATLAALHLTTAARVAGKTEVADDATDPDEQAFLRLVGGARVRNAPPVDPAAPPAHP
jgi:hypothetical protein